MRSLPKRGSGKPRRQQNEPVLFEKPAASYGCDANAGRGRGRDRIPWWLSLRKGKYKYICTLAANEVEELCDLEADLAAKASPCGAAYRLELPAGKKVALAICLK